ncbi:MAG: hypothetical protein IKF54_00910, partial [Eubacterium sp.]|nr:hypothetical protein [Eubacterium sp.]
LVKEGKNPLSIDSKPPKEDGYQDFLMGEVRYNSLKMRFPERAEELFKENQEIAMDRYDRLLNQKESLEPDKPEEAEKPEQ